jgi:hydrogenase nickel incorporation protein HypA/HybF
VHEKAVMDDLIHKIKAVAEAEGAERVVRIRVRLGVLSHFTPEHFREHFEDAAHGTVAEGAAVAAELNGEPTDPNAQSVVLEEIELQLGRGASFDGPAREPMKPDASTSSMRP